MGRRRKPPDDLPAGAGPAEAAAFAERQAIARRLQAAMDDAGMDVAGVAAGAGVAASTVYDVLRARKDTGLTVFRGIATALRLPLASLFDDVPHFRLRQVATIAIRGSAAIGVWRSMNLLYESRGTATDVVPKDEHYQALPRYGIEITDDGLTGLIPPVPRGAVAIYADIAGADVALMTGSIYLVHRVNEAGLIESGFWRVLAQRDGYRLTSLFGDAARNLTVMISHDDIERGDAVTVAGILVATTVDAVTAAGLSVVTTVRYL